MIKYIKVIDRKDEELEDMNFWKSKSVEERLSAIQVLREQYIYLLNKQSEYYESKKLLRKIYKIVKRDIL